MAASKNVENIFNCDKQLLYHSSEKNSQRPDQASLALEITQKKFSHKELYVNNSSNDFPNDRGDHLTFLGLQYDLKKTLFL